MLCIIDVSQLSVLGVRAKSHVFLKRKEISFSLALLLNGTPMHCKLCVFTCTKPHGAIAEVCFVLQ